MCLGVPAKVMVIKENNVADVDVFGNTVTISTRLTPEVQVGEYVLVHAGFAMEIMNENDALETMGVLEELEQYAQQ